MKYGYYPGCSLERNAIAYHQSTMAIAKPLGIEFNEVEDWPSIDWSADELEESTFDELDFDLDPFEASLRAVEESEQ